MKELLQLILKVLSAVDGHVVDGSVVFSIGGGNADFSQVKSESKDIFHLLSLDNSFSRIPGYIGQIVIVGAAFIFLWIQKPLSTFEWIKRFIQEDLYLIRKNLIKLIIIGDILVLLSIIAMVLIQASAIGGSVVDVLTTEFGKIILVRLGLALVLLIFLLFTYKKFNDSKKGFNEVKYIIAVLCLGVGILLTNSLISHSAALKSFGTCPNRFFSWYSCIILDWRFNFFNICFCFKNIFNKRRRDKSKNYFHGDSQIFDYSNTSFR